jgi:putative radical SAM enzyme (TIGR03279 family)
MLNVHSLKHCSGLRVRALPRTSPFFRAGLRAGDFILSVNGERVVDELDFRFSTAAELARLEIQRGATPRSLSVERDAGSFPEIEFFQKPIRRCANRCIFCFIDQMPPGLRRRLYIKDEDLAYSFLNGNYVTLTNARAADMEKIATLGLSPLFISVHATDPLVRGRMLGISRAPAIMEQLSLLRKKNIRFHTQIVVCPGYNDGAVLASTVRDLFSLGESLVSIAVVPVGLTRFRKFPLEGVNSEFARQICLSIGALSDRDAARHGVRRLFCSDEFFLKAALPIPHRAYYEEYPQIENGVGLIRQLIDEWNFAKNRARKRANKPALRGKKYLLLTAASPFPYLKTIGEELMRLAPGLTVQVEGVTNNFFGASVTVAGLLTARDVIRGARAAARDRRFDCVLLPGAMFNYAGFTLDGYGERRLSKEIGIPVRVVRSIGEILGEKP